MKRPGPPVLVLWTVAALPSGAGAATMAPFMTATVAGAAP